MQYLSTGYTGDADRPLRPRIDPLVDRQTDSRIAAEFGIDIGSVSAPAWVCSGKISSDNPLRYL